MVCSEILVSNVTGNSWQLDWGFAPYVLLGKKTLTKVDIWILGVRVMCEDTAGNSYEEAGFPCSTCSK